MKNLGSKMLLDYSLSLPKEKIPSFVKNTLKNLKPLNIDKDNSFKIRLSIEEALVNAIKYGNKMDITKKVFLNIKADSKEIEIEVKDEGKGFDYGNLTFPSKRDNIKKTSGRGIFLIKNFMDKVEFLDGGSRIKMIKYLI